MTGQANINPQAGFLSYTPVLGGQTDNAAGAGITAPTTLIGRFYTLGALCFFRYKIVTSGTITKTTLGDNVQISLPLPSVTLASDTQEFSARVENATAVANALKGEIASASSVATFRNYVLATSSAIMTWAATNPGIGVLTNIITATGEGYYEFAGTGSLN